MNEPVWVTEEDCLSFHDKLLARFGGGSGVRDKGLLLSALARPQHIFVYEKPSLFDLAAALFLEANGIRFNGSERDAVIQTIALAAGESTLQDFSAWLKRATITPPAE